MTRQPGAERVRLKSSLDAEQPDPKTGRPKRVTIPGNSQGDVIERGQKRVRVTFDSFPADVSVPAEDLAPAPQEPQEAVALPQAIAAQHLVAADNLAEAVEAALEGAPESWGGRHPLAEALAAYRELRPA